MKITFKPKNLAEAICFAGCAMSGITGNYKNNPKFTVFIDSDKPHISKLNKLFNSSNEDPLEFTFEESEFPDLELKAAKIQQKELQLLHSVNQELNNCPRHISNLMATKFLTEFKIYCKPEYHYPLGNAVSEYNCICTDEKYLPKFQTFLDGLDLPTNVLVTNDVEQMIPVLESGCLAYFGEASDEFVYLVKTKYESWDDCDKVPVIISLVDNEPSPYKLRSYLTFGSLIFITEDTPDDQIKSEGKMYSIQKKYNFDYNKYLKDITGRNK